jgi:sarcosine oxidase / L-pipecolate oxidase
MSERQIVIVGAGIFGVTSALALRARGYAVTLLDPGPLPHPLAESTDISKVVRMDYGPDEDYTALMERAFEGWRRWNAEAAARGAPPLYHQTGVTFLCREPMAEGGFEHESYRTLLRRGHPIERLDAAEIAKRFPAWSTGRFTDGYFNPLGGFAESGKVVTWLLEEAGRRGVEIRGGAPVERLAEEGSEVSGVYVAGERVSADLVLVAAGSWTPHLLPFLSEHLRSVGQPVFHLRPQDPWLYQAERFPVFGADISKTGYYGFPVTPEGLVKIANHGAGREMHPESPIRAVTPEDREELWSFLHQTFPSLLSAEVAHTRVCVYCDTWDGHFWIAPDPARQGLVVAAGGSGHGFKFAPVIGALIADAVEGIPNPLLGKFCWREARPARSEEAARARG